MLGLSTLLPRDPFNVVVLAVGIVSIFLLATFAVAYAPKKADSNTIQAYLKFFYACFLKPHTGDGQGSQQDALVCDFHCPQGVRVRVLRTSRKASTKPRQTSTMPPARDCSEDARTCWVWLLHN